MLTGQEERWSEDGRQETSVCLFVCEYICAGRQRQRWRGQLCTQADMETALNKSALQLSVSEMFTIRQHNGGTDRRGKRQIRVRGRAGQSLPACHLHTRTREKQGVGGSFKELSDCMRAYKLLI